LSPEGLPFHLFAVQVQSAGLFLMQGGTDNTNNARLVKKWRAGGKVEIFGQGIDGKLTPTND
jgi:hypothetical protein